ncbi:MutS-related protein [Pedobacter sp.]|uniref:MutS-related protein n=1 Tax=Pedobacter sp. TaxID=1411316 RepID=UPI003D7F5A11
MSHTKEHIISTYRNQINTEQGRIDALIKQLNQISLSRLGLFLAEIVFVACIIAWGYHWIYVVLMLAVVALFIVLVKKQGKVQLELEYARKLLWVYQNEENIMVNRNNGYDDGENYVSEKHAYTSDLDVFGPLSLFDFINRCKTTKGRDLLASHLNTACQRDVIMARQEAIKEIKGHIDDTFHFRARLQKHQPEQLALVETKLSEELPGQLKFTESRFIRGYVVVAPFLMFGLLAAGALWGGVWWNVFGLIALFNAAFIFFNHKHIQPVYDGFSGSVELLNSYAGSIAWTEKITWNSTYIRSFFSTSADSKPVSAEIRELAAIIQAFDARLNMLVGMFLNLFFLWDLKCCIRLDKWYKGSSDHILHGLDRISLFEELISFATLHYNEPEWTFPVITDSYCLKAIALGHPLIDETKRIDNNYALAEAPTVDIVTGSNMAGKSTFLRTVGVNMVLAFSGAPVCAKSLELSIFQVLSYMRIKDSLNDQTSTFKAELNRLKMILEITKKEPNAFVLIDEMLRGTNSKDKYLGSQVFIEKMISQKTTALFATHDLALSEMARDYPQQVRNYHFDIQITESEMHFDYLLKHGACKTFNAAILLKQIGLSIEKLN